MSFHNLSLSLNRRTFFRQIKTLIIVVPLSVGCINKQSEGSSSTTNSGLDGSVTDVWGYPKTVTDNDNRPLGEGANLQGRDLRNLRFINFKLKKANLSGANLQESQLSWIVLSNADLRGANLSRTTFFDTTLMDSQFDPNHKFIGSHFFGSIDWIPDGADLKYAIFEGVSFSPCKPKDKLDFSYATFKKNGARIGDFSYINLLEAKFTKANLQHVSFTESTLKKVNFFQATLTNVDFKEANLEGAIFSGAELTNVDFRGANLKGASFCGAKLKNTKGIDGADTNLDGAIFQKGGLFSCLNPQAN